MKRLLFTASLVLAFSVSAAPALGQAPAASPAHHHSCQHRWRMKRGLHYARRIYAGTRTTKTAEMKFLGRMERCQYNRHARHYLHRHAFAMRHAHRQRVDQANSNPWSHSVVSWYDDSGQTASGTHYTYGVADCGTDGVCYSFGTQIEFCYHGCVTATVDDHGPYIAGRDFDLNQNTAQAIGFSGVGTVAWRLN